MDEVSIQRIGGNRRIGTVCEAGKSGRGGPAAGVRLFSEVRQHVRERSGRLASRRAGIDLVSRRGNDGERSRN